ncbi:MlaA family lipoprotein [Paracoccus aminophilus]|uniref:MlaA family lipoprotein n=1 Tax=Paracoccus aminophilus TaxID=34003 RepID=UPI00041C1A5E|nr:VacJ family lipoprotein [Paracoccus aminophilus]
MRLLLLAALCLASCSASRAPEGINDPFEGMNRRFHAFNAGLDQKVVKPATSGMGGSKAAPGEGRGIGGTMLQGVGNFGANISLPGKVVNHLLQGKPEPAIKNTFRFLVNTTLGFGGVLDPAGKDFALPEQGTDFGETLAVWGVPEGPYLELPLVGPTTTRDGLGKVVDIAIDPMRQWLNRDQYLIGMATRVASKVSQRAQYGDAVDSVLHDSADSYTQTRLIYLQHRRHKLGQEEEAIDPYAD